MNMRTEIAREKVIGDIELNEMNILKKIYRLAKYDSSYFCINKELIYTLEV